MLLIGTSAEGLDDCQLFCVPDQPGAIVRGQILKETEKLSGGRIRITESLILRGREIDKELSGHHNCELAVIRNRAEEIEKVCFLSSHNQSFLSVSVRS